VYQKVKKLEFLSLNLFMKLQT